MLLSFTPGSSDGDMVCINATVLSDDLVECEEDFAVALTLNTVGDSIELGNNSTAVTLIDSDGATFSIPIIAMVAESDTTLEVCVTMITAPAGAMLATHVDLSLSTMSGTGKTY